MHPRVGGVLEVELGREEQRRARHAEEAGGLEPRGRSLDERREGRAVKPWAQVEVYALVAVTRVQMKLAGEPQPDRPAARGSVVVSGRRSGTDVAADAAAAADAATVHPTACARRWLRGWEDDEHVVHRQRELELPATHQQQRLARPARGLPQRLCRRGSPGHTGRRGRRAPTAFVAFVAAVLVVVVVGHSAQGGGGGGGSGGAAAVWAAAR